MGLNMEARADVANVVDTAIDLAARLHIRRDELQEQLGSLEPGYDVGHPRWSSDLADELQARHQQQNIAAVRAILLAELRQVEHALARMAGGVYGICERCSSEIPPRRLQVVPAATLCVGCQGASEFQRTAH